MTEPVLTERRGIQISERAGQIEVEPFPGQEEVLQRGEVVLRGELHEVRIWLLHDVAGHGRGNGFSGVADRRFDGFRLYLESEE